MVGDVIAQSLQLWLDSKDKGPGSPKTFAADRLLKMGAWGFCFYGPYQHFWYRALAKALPGKDVPSFLSKVAANQFLLAPIVLCSVFSWNLAMQGKAREIPAKVQRDLWPTMVRGWAFWVPAASVNFWFVPLPYQVLYMSSCGILWSAYLSFTSYTSLRDLLARNAKPALPAGGPTKAAPSPAPSKVKR